MSRSRLHLLLPISIVAFALTALVPLAPAQEAAAPAASAASSSPWQGELFHASPDEVLKAAAAVPATPQTNITVLLDERRIVLDKEQRATLTYHLVYRIENQAGVEAWSSIGAGYSPWFQKKPVMLARIVTEDKHVSMLDEKTLSDAPVHSGEEDMFDDDREYQGPLPGLAPGAIVEQEIKIEDTAPFFATGSVYREYINRPFPVAMTRVVAQAPVELALKYKVLRMPDVVAEKETKDGIVTLTFEKENLEAIDHAAPNLPSDVAPVPEIEVATAASWKDVADRYRAMSDPQIHPEQAKEMLPQLSRSEDRQQKITAIVRELHRQVRYTGVEFGEAKLTPQPPAETMKRHYGDCKDKAALLVSMLRAAGIPAYLALLNAGDGQDVDPTLPGMRLFDHAIVYVPGEKPNDAGLWIDATAEFAQVGELPSPDRGRHALIIREGTAELTTIPQATPEDNLLVENRTFTLAENGPAMVEEKSETHGMLDEVYRARYGGSDTKRSRDELESYVKNVYAAEKLDQLNHTDGNDLSKPFQLDLVMDKAKRGFSSLQDAAVAIPTGGILSRLPQWFFTTPPDAANNKTKTAQEEENEREENARTEDYVFEPFINEWKYTVIPPLGFKVRELPSDKKEQMGPALLETHYATQNDGTVTAEIKFDTVSGRYSPKEAFALRQAIYAMRNDDAVMIRFVEGGAYELSQGHVKEALAVYQGLIAKHPKESLHHVQLAIALVQAGAGEQARAEAARAVALEQTSALAFRSQGEVLSYDTVGRRFGAGMDRAGAIAAYKKSLEIEPDDAPTRWQLALCYEFNDRGERYGDGADLDLAVAQYRAATDRDKTLGRGYDENAMTDLFYAGHDAEALTAAHKLNSSPVRNSVAVAATAITAGSAEAIKEAGRDTEDSSVRSEALGDAGQLLVHRRSYALAADMFEASESDAKDAPLRQRQVEIFRTLKPYEEVMLPQSDPRSALQRLLVATFYGATEQQMQDIWSPLTLDAPGEVRIEARSLARDADSWQHYANRNGWSLVSLVDERLGKAHYNVTGDDTLGYKIALTALGRNATTYYIVKASKGYRVLTAIAGGDAVGKEILEQLDAGRKDAARQWLDWSRDSVKRGDADDPLSGPVWTRLWSEGDKADPAKMRLAAYAMVAPHRSAPKYLADIDKACATAAEDDKASCDLIRLDAFMSAEKWHEAVELAKALYERYPKSATALDGYAQALAGGRQDAALKSLGEQALQQRPDDATTLRTLVAANSAAYQYAQAVAYLKKLQDQGKAEANDYNSLAWLSLFAGPVDDDTLHAAQQANLLTKSDNFSILHTLACVYAGLGKSEQARQSLLQGMDAGEIEKPNSAVWYVFGVIYENYGLKEAAIAAYQRVEKPDTRRELPEDTYLLAQQRMTALTAPKAR
jgi:tetratricopeptide (TPR) repeat protein